MRVAVAGGTGTVGRHTLAALRAAGHDAVSLSRADGVDLRRDGDVARALDGVDVVVDASNAPGTSRKVAVPFFTEVTGRLQHQGESAGARRLVTLSIVGNDRVPGYPYYEAKLAQEAAVRRGPLPATVVRATQFFEFPAQVLRRTAVGPLAYVFRAAVQPVAARALGGYLASLAVDPGAPDRVEVAGPGRLELPAMARDLVATSGRRLRVVSTTLPGRAGVAMRDGALVPGDGAVVVGPTFADWLATDDARLLSF